MNELQHYGVKGMRWGVRRYQNSDGTLTNAGRKRYAKQLTKEYKKGYDSAQPFRTSSKFDATTKDLIRKHITKADIQKVRAASKRWSDSMEEADKAEQELFDLAHKIGKKEYEKELKRNPSAYTSERMKTELLDHYTYEYGWDEAHKQRPDLAKKTDAGDKKWSEYQEECKKVADKILGDYGNTTLYECEYYSYSVRDAVGQMIDSMDTKKEFEYMFDRDK